MRILTLCYEFPPIGGGGSRVVSGLASELVRAGHGVDLVTMRFGNQPRRQVVGGVRVFRADCIRRSPSICSPAEMATYLARALPLAARLVRRNRYDLVHAHFVFADGVLAWALKRLTGLPYIITAHGSDVPGFNPDRFALAHRLLRPAWHRIVAGAEAVVAPSDNLARLIRSVRPAARPVIIPNGIDPGMLRADRPRRRRILVVARLFERKGVQHVLHALAGLRHDHEVHVVGTGPYLPALVTLARDLSVDVRFHGWVDPTSDQLAALYETADIFVLPSDVENFPMVLLEAMAAGLAIITTRGTGCDEVVGDTGVLVDPGDVPALRAAILALTRDPQRCRLLGRAARQRLLTEFSWAGVARRYAGLYRTVLVCRQVPTTPPSMSPDDSRPGLRARLAWLLKLLCSGALLWYIASRISLHGLGEALAGADPALLGLGLALSAGGMAAAAQQLRALGERQGIPLSTRDALALNLATSFYNLFLPGAVAGGVARWYRLARSHSAEQPIAALAVILGSRIAELATVLIAGLLFWAADPLARSNHLVPATFAGLLAGLVLGVRLVTDPRRRLPLPSGLRARLGTALDALSRFRDMPSGTLRRLAAASAARHLLMIGGLYCFALALHLPLTLAVAGWSRTVVALAGMLPVTLGGLGVREGSLIAVLHPYGVAPHGAAALGLLLFGREVLAGAVGAIIETRWFLSPGEAVPRTRG